MVGHDHGVGAGENVNQESKTTGRSASNRKAIVIGLLAVLGICSLCNCCIWVTLFGMVANDFRIAIDKDYFRVTPIVLPDTPSPTPSYTAVLVKPTDTATPTASFTQTASHMPNTICDGTINNM